MYTLHFGKNNVSVYNHCAASALMSTSMWIKCSTVMKKKSNNSQILIIHNKYAIWEGSKSLEKKTLEKELQEFLDRWTEFTVVLM